MVRMGLVKIYVCNLLEESEAEVVGTEKESSVALKPSEVVTLKLV